MGKKIIHNDLEIEIIKLKNEISKLKKESEKREKEFYKKSLELERNEKMLHNLVEASVGKIGQDFFNNIVKRLAEWLNVDCVLIGQIEGVERINAVPLYLDGVIKHGFSYELEGTPCAITTRKGYCEYPENVIQLFPKDEILVDLDAQAYIGTALYNKSGEINGVICAVSREKLVVPPYAQDIMKIIGARVSAEIERKKMEEELKESNATKDKFFSIIAHDLINPFNSILGLSELLKRKYDYYEKSKMKQLIKFIYHNAKNTYELLNNLLNWSRSQLGKIKYQEEKLNLLN
ncbi:sensor histidine kinase, partial [Bacteroidota bacterium]